MNCVNGEKIIKSKDYQNKRTLKRVLFYHSFNFSILFVITLTYKKANFYLLHLHALGQLIVYFHIDSSHFRLNMPIHLRMHPHHSLNFSHLLILLNNLQKEYYIEGAILLYCLPPNKAIHTKINKN